MKPYHLRRPPWCDIQEHHACYVPELPSKPVEGWTYILDGPKHHYYKNGKFTEVNPAWTFATYECTFLSVDNSYTCLSLGFSRPGRDYTTYTVTYPS